MPSSRHAEMMRSAISPRLAIRIFLNMGVRRQAVGVRRNTGTAARCFASPLTPYALRSSGGEPYREKLLSVFDRLPAARIDLDDFPGHVRFDLIHKLHGFDDAEDLSLGDLLP